MLDIKVSAALMGFSLLEQRTILDCVKEGKQASTARLRSAVTQVEEIIDSHEEVVEGYAGFPCLLYTSPSPRDKRQSRMPSSA